MSLRNNKGFTIMESVMMGALGFLVIGAAISGISWVKNSFLRLSKRTVAIEIVSSFSQNLQEQFSKYPSVKIKGAQASYVICYDATMRPAKNSAGGMDPILKVFSEANLKKNSGDCVTLGYEIHLTNTTPNQYNLIVIGVKNNLGPVYDEKITVFKQ